MSAIECAFFGALGRDAESKTSKAGRAYLRLNVRVGDGDATQWVSVTSFDPDAVKVVDNLRKGARVYIEGRISLDEWTGQDGAKRRGLSCMSFHTRLAAIGRNKRKREHKNGDQPRASDGAFYSDDIPFAPDRN